MKHVAEGLPGAKPGDGWAKVDMSLPLSERMTPRARGVCERSYAMYREACWQEGLEPDALDALLDGTGDHSAACRIPRHIPGPERLPNTCPNHEWCDGPNLDSRAMCTDCTMQRLGMVQRRSRNSTPPAEKLEGHCEGCGVPVNRRNDGNYFRWCRACERKQMF